MKVLMVCKGNICRSPMAEGIAKTLIKEQGRDDLTVDSAGTHGYHIGAWQINAPSTPLKPMALISARLKRAKLALKICNALTLF